MSAASFVVPNITLPLAPASAFNFRPGSFIDSSTCRESTAPDSWYVLRARTGLELEACRYLSFYSITSYSPTYKVRRRFSNSKGIRDIRALFPGYLFSWFDFDSRTERNTVLLSPFIIDLLRFNNGPAMIDNAELDRIKQLSSSELPLFSWNKLILGSRAKVMVGKAWLEGVVSKIEGETHLVVNVTMLGRAVSVVVKDPDMLEAA
jgi:transcription antitermination factor NusG